MHEVRSGSEPTAATLVGSLTSFPLLDVLELLARTGRTGELQVVGQGLDRRIWVDRGDLVDTAGNGAPGTGLFEMACIEDGWFYFTLADSTPEALGRATLPSVIEGLGPQVTEWHSLAAEFPFDALVRMSSTTPADEVQIRADQWQLLSLVGAGRQVREVLAGSPMHPLDTLRTLRELAAGHLITVERAGAAEPPPPAPAGGVAAADAGAGAGEADNTDDEPDGAPAPAEPPPAAAEAPVAPEAGTALAAAASTPRRPQGPVMPPPISGDPWTGPVQHAADDRS